MQLPVTTVLGSVRGYRAWLFDPICNRLAAAMSWGMLYEAGTFVYTSICLFERCAPSPGEDCRCGFYAVYRPPPAPRLGFPDYNPNIFADIIKAGIGCSVDTFVTGSAKFSGKIIFGDSGIMRGEKLEIESLLIPDGAPSYVRSSISELYPGARIYAPNQGAKLQKDFPLDPPQHITELAAEEQKQLRMPHRTWSGQDLWAAYKGRY